MRSGLTAALLATVTLVSAGCSGIPMHGPVTVGLEVGPPDYEMPRVQLRPPAPGAAPAEIIAGFLDAASSPEDDFAAARAYLTGDAEGSWRPTDGVTVYPDGAQLRPSVSGSTASMRVPVIGRLDETGRYSPASPNEVATPEIGLRRVDGEWRIATLPRGFGLWLNSEWFTYLYRRSFVAYVDPFDHTLLRDPRWVPSGRSGATALAEAQLDPVAPYLKGAAVTGFPHGTDLGVKSVPVVDGIAQVELTAQAKTATMDQRKAAWAQMLWTLRQWPGVKAVSMTVDGDPLPMLDDAGQPMNLTQLPTSLQELGFDEPTLALTAVVLRSGTHLSAQDFTGWLRGGENQRGVESALPDVPATWKHLAVGHDLGGDRRHVVAVDAAHSRLFRWTAQGLAHVPSFGTALTAPSVDRGDRAWIGGSDAQGRPRIWFVPVVASADAAPTPIEADWLEGRVAAVSPSPGGRRLAVALTDAAGATSVYVAGLSLGQERDPVALARPWRIAAGLTRLEDLEWVDDTSLAVLSGRGGAGVSPAIIPLGDEMVPLDPVAGAHQIVGAGTGGGVLVVTDKGVVWRRSGATGWQRHTEADEVVIPGS